MSNTKAWDSLLDILEALGNYVMRDQPWRSIALDWDKFCDALQEHRQYEKDLNKEKQYEKDLNKENRCPGGYKDCNCKGDKHPWAM